MIEELLTAYVVMTNVFLWQGSHPLLDFTWLKPCSVKKQKRKKKRNSNNNNHINNNKHNERETRKEKRTMRFVYFSSLEDIIQRKKVFLFFPTLPSSHSLFSSLFHLDLLGSPFVVKTAKKRNLQGVPLRSSMLLKD